MNKLNLEEELKKGWVIEIDNYQISYYDNLFVLEKLEYTENDKNFYSVVDAYETLVEAIYNIQAT